MSIFHATCPRLAVSEMIARLPGQESAFEAEDLETCLAIMETDDVRQDPSLAVAIRSLMVTDPVDEHVLRLTAFSLFLVIMCESKPTLTFIDNGLTF